MFFKLTITFNEDHLIKDVFEGKKQSSSVNEFMHTLSYKLLCVRDNIIIDCSIQAQALARDSDNV